MDTILIEQIEFYGYHGASDEEQTIGHRYSVDAELWLDTSIAGSRDSLDDTADYGKVVEQIVEIGTKRKFRLVEALAATIAASLLEQFDIEGVRLTVRKLNPPVPAVVASAGVIIERWKHESP